MNIEEWNKCLSPIINGHISHPHYDQAYSELMGAIHIQRPGDIIVLSGVSGSGKTTIINRLFESKFFERSQTKVPAIRSMVLNSDHQNKHDPKWLAKSLLADIGNPGYSIRLENNKAAIIDLFPKKSTTDLYLMLSNEIKSKLGQARPQTLGQASRIPGVTPAAVSLLLIHLKKRSTQNKKSA